MGLSLVETANVSLRETQGVDRETTRIRYFGDYELLDEIARGGMGIVYRARQVTLNRIVAVKMLLFGKFSSDEFVQRFKAEAQAAAALQHPNIVAIHEVGEHEGQHYFSMEFVAGSNLAQLVRDHPLPPMEAATYLKIVAEAIHFAHRHGVLHRDLKPSNVLIDASGQPRVTDFGLAKRTDIDSGDTATAEILGSPSYMAPEQADRLRGKARPATDVYSLGAILYQLLTGRPPFMGQTLEETLLQVLHAQPVSPRLLVAGTPRDLETICLKCLEKDLRRRYQSAFELAEDLDRWKTGRAITARPASSLEHAWRWARRKPAVASLSAALLFLLTLGTIVSTWQAVRAKRAEQFLLGEAAGNDKLVEFLRLLLDGIPQSMAEGRDTTMLLELVEKAAAQMDKGMPARHRPDANLREIIGRIYHDLHHYPKAEAMFREALAYEKQMHGSNHLHVARYLTLLGRSLEAQDKVSEAESCLTEALAITHNKDIESELFEFEDTQTILGAVRIKQGKLEQAESLFRQVLNGRQRRLGEGHPAVLTSLNNVSAALLNQGKLVEAESIQHRVLEARRKLPETDREGLLSSLHNLAATLSAQGKYVKATALLRERLELCEKFMGPEHPETISAMIAVAATLLNQSNVSEAETILRRVLNIQNRTKREADPLAASALVTLAWVLEEHGRLEEAEATAVRALDLQRKLFRSPHPEVAQSLSLLAGIVKKRDLKAAEQLQLQALAIRRELLGSKHLHTSASLLSLATILRDQRRFTEADDLFRECLTIRTNLLVAPHRDIATALHEFAASFDDQQKYAEAEPMLRKALDMRIKMFGVTNAQTIESLDDLANMLGRQARFAEAEERFRQVLAAREKLLGPEHPRTAAALDRLGRVLWDQNKREEAELTLRKAVPIYRKLLEAGDTNAVVVLNRFAWVFLAMRGNITEAEILLKELLATARRLHGEDSPLVAERVNNYAMWLSDRGQFDAAEAMFLEAMAVRKKRLPSEHADVADSYKSLARFYGERGRFDEAEPLFRHALLIEKKRLGPHDREGVIYLTYDLVLTLNRQRKHVEAEALLLELNDIVQQNPGFTPNDKREVLNRLCELYVSWSVAAPNTGKSQKAAEWRKKLSELDRNTTDKPL